MPLGCVTVTAYEVSDAGSTAVAARVEWVVEEPGELDEARAEEVAPRTVRERMGEWGDVARGVLSESRLLSGSCEGEARRE